MIAQFLSRVKLGLGFGLGFYLFYLLRAEQYLGQATQRYPRSGYDYDIISRFLVAMGNFLWPPGEPITLFAPVLLWVNLSAFLAFVFASGWKQTIVWQIQILVFLILDITLAYDVLWKDHDHIVHTGQHTIYTFYLPLGLGIYLYFLLKRISNQIVFDKQ